MHLDEPLRKYMRAARKIVKKTNSGNCRSHWIISQPTPVLLIFVVQLVNDHR